jgi:cation diffusion facilitator family transporter
MNDQQPQITRDVTSGRLIGPGVRAMRAVSYAAVGVAAALSIVKLGAWYATDSVAMLSSLVDSVLDFLASFINAFAVWTALRPYDPEHRFGHGKAESLAGLFQAAIILASVVFVAVESIPRLTDPIPVANGVTGMVVMIVSIVATAILVVTQHRVIKRTGSLAVTADSLHYKGDLLTNLAVIVGLGLATFADLPIFDPIGALLVSAFVLWSVYGIVRQSLDILMDREFPTDVRDRIRAIATKHAEVVAVHDMRTRSAGIHSFIQLHIELPADISFMRAHLISDEVERDIRHAFPETDVIIHMDPEGVPEERARFAEARHPRCARCSPGATGVGSARTAMTEQDDIIAFLADPRTHGGAPVERIDTHGAIVFLAGRRALKLKRAVRYDYMDFATVALRRQACEAEVRINRRTAPAIYRAAIPVTRERDGTLSLGGAGDVVDWVVDMVRFDQAGLFDRLAVRGALDDTLAVALADTVASFHDQADAAPGFGGAPALAATIAGNARELGRYVETVFAADPVARLETASRRALAQHGDLADRRRDRGLVRRCHGDLHLRNVCLIDGRPTLFDAIEFSDDFACIDTVYDLAFLLMDLWHRDLRRTANLVLNRYLWRRSDAEALALMPLFLALRAAIRAHVTATAALSQPIEARTAFGDEARAYLALANAALAPPPAVLVAIGGLSGSGKSTLARDLAPTIGPTPGAVVIQTDAVRKRLWGSALTEQLPAAAYAPDMSERTYAAVRAEAATVLATGHAVIVDAVHARRDERTAVADLARSAGVRFLGLWLDAPRPTMAERLDARRGDVSDATAQVLARQLTYDLGAIDWRRVDATQPTAMVAAEAASLIGCALAAPRVQSGAGD